jgi:hypothetical protein
MFDDTNTSYYDILTKLHDRKLHFIGGCLSLSTQMIYFLWHFPIIIWDRHNLFKGEAYLMIMTIKREAWEANAS